MYSELKDQGVACSEKRIAPLIRLADLKAVRPRRFVVTTDSRPALPVAHNLLGRQFRVEQPNRAWSAEITYV